MKDVYRLEEKFEDRSCKFDYQEMKTLVKFLVGEPVLYKISFESDAILKRIVLNSTENVGYLGRSDGKVSLLALSSFSLTNSFKVFESGISDIKISKSDNLVLISILG